MVPVALLAIVAPAYAAQVSLDLGASELREGQTVVLSVAVTDASPRGLPELVVPDGLQLEYRGQSQNSMMINFRMTSTIVFRYDLTAIRAGSYTIAPARVETTKGALSSAPLVLEVGKRAADGLNELVASLDVAEAWVGQLLLYNARFVTDQQRLRGQWRPPDADGLSAEPGVDPLTPDEQVLQDGKQLTALGLVYPLRATSPGKVTIPGAVLQAQVPVQRERGRRNDRLGGLFDELGAFSDYATQVYSAPPIDLVVRPLPEAGKPKTFNGLVGQFSLDVTPSQTEVNVGDTVTLTVEISGNAPLAGVTLPPLTVDGLRAYDDQPTVEAALRPTGLVAHATLKRALVPERPGDFVVPPMEIAYFDPVKGAYEVARSDELALRVGGSAGTAAVASFSSGAARTDVDALAEDILPVRAEAAVSRPLSARWAWVALVPGLGWLLVQAGAAWKPRRAETSRRFDFDDLPDDPDQRLAGLERLFRERVGARLSIAPDALHREDLAGLGADADAAVAIYRELERTRYGGARGESPEQAIRALVGRWP